MYALLTQPENFIPKLGLAEADAARTTMVFVPGATFHMGSKLKDDEAFQDEKPNHEVAISSFFIGQYSVTQALWKAVLSDNNPAFFKGDTRPVEQVSWDRIQQEFLPALLLKTGITFHLPTEAEWEYAARGGPHWQDGFPFSGSNKLKEVGWFDDNSHGETKPVGLKSSNQLGLYDMSGNIWEWVEDEWHDHYRKAPRDGSAWINKNQGVDRVLRGGGYWGEPRRCRSTYRISYPSASIYRFIGFRLAAPFHSVDNLASKEKKEVTW